VLRLEGYRWQSGGQKLLVVATVEEKERNKEENGGARFKLEDDPSMYSATQRHRLIRLFMSIIVDDTDYT
jgi:hypothetical protein